MHLKRNFTKQVAVTKVDEGNVRGWEKSHRNHTENSNKKKTHF